MRAARLPPEREVSLAEAVRRGDATAEEAFVEAYRGRLWVMMLARTRDRDAAAELVNDTLMAVIAALRNGAVREVHRLDAFVLGTARNLVNNHHRRQARHPRPEPITAELVDRRTLEQAVLEDRLAVVRNLLDTLDPVDRTILQLTLAEGMKPREIAPRVGLSPELVRTRKSRALRMLVERVDALSRT